MYEREVFDFEKLIFEWDENKNHTNVIKHGIRFSTAVKVFKDPNLLLREDEWHADELRYNVLGSIGKIVFVVCLFKNANVVRMISARLATKSERERYSNYDKD